MTTLEKLSKKDKYWRSIAFNFCKNKTIADDLVQEMYLKLMNKDYCNDYYVIYAIKHLYIGHLRNKKNDANIEAFYNLKSNESTFQPDDYEQELLDKFEDLEWYKQELLKESYNHSYREIEERYNINYGYAYRETQKAIRHVLGDDYDKYNNSNLKHHKKKGNHK